MKRTISFKALVIATFVLPSVACAGSPTYLRAAGSTAAGSTDAADRPSGIVNENEYEHSLSYPPG